MAAAPNSGLAEVTDQVDRGDLTHHPKAHVLMRSGGLRLQLIRPTLRFFRSKPWSRRLVEDPLDQSTLRA